MTATLAEAYYRRLYAFEDPSPAIPIEEFYSPSEPRDKQGKWTRGGSASKVWSGMSAHPDNRVKPKSKVHFPLEPDDFQTAGEARAIFGSSVYDADLGKGYQARVVNVKEIPNGVSVLIKIRKGHEEAATATRELSIDGAGRLVAHHETLYVEPAHQNQGIADRFNAHAVEQYQKLGVDRIDLHAGDAVGGYAWARQGFRIFEGDRKKFLNAQLDRIGTLLKAPVLRPHAKKIMKDVAALRKAIDAGEDVQPIHVAALGEKYARYKGRDDHGNTYSTWPGKSLLIGTNWIGNYYFDANKAVTAAATDLEHSELRSEAFYNHSHDPHSGKFSHSGGTISMIRGDIGRDRKGIIDELDREGVGQQDPIRHIFESHMGNTVAVIRGNSGKIVGGVQYDVDKQFKEITVMDMRVVEQYKGHGTAAFQAIAKVAVGNDYNLNVSSALESAKPFYSKLGAYFQKGHYSGHWTDEGRNALAEGKPIPGANLSYDEWVKIPFGGAYERPRKRAQTASGWIDLACHDASCAPPPAGTGGSLPTVMYHVSSAKNHESISLNGLDASRNPRGGYIWTGSVQGQYLFSSKSTATRAAVQDFINANVYAVDVSGLKVERDERFPNSYVVREPISSDRIKLKARTIHSSSSRHGRAVIDVVASAQSIEALACYDKACAPPPAGTGGSLQARRGAVPGYGPTRRRDITLGSVRVTYHPDYPDGHPDPGEVVWARVRYQENTALSKDRPVLIIGRINGTDKLAAVQLTSNEATRSDRLPIGKGSWDRLGRNTSVKLDQIIVVDPKDYRREGSKFDRDKFEGVIGRLAAYHRTPVQIAASAMLELYNHEHDPHSGKFTGHGGVHDPFGPSRTFKVITKAEARGDSRPVSLEDFHSLARVGRIQLHGFQSNRSPTTGLNERWNKVKDEAWDEVGKPWGGATIDAHTGHALPQGANKFAITVKGGSEAGLQTVSIHEGASRAEFDRAMDRAKRTFSNVLERESHYLGVFHDDEHHRIDIDPVLVVSKREDVDTIGAASHSIGGAYNFSDGNGYWPPHVAEG